jgi:hypothetical protein
MIRFLILLCLLAMSTVQACLAVDVVLFSDDFEGEFPGAWHLWWSIPNYTWGSTQCNVLDGTALWCAASKADTGPGDLSACRDDYPNNVVASMRAGPFDCSDADSLEVMPLPDFVGEAEVYVKFIFRSDMYLARPANMVNGAFVDNVRLVASVPGTDGPTGPTGATGPQTPVFVDTLRLVKMYIDADTTVYGVLEEKK